MISAIPSADEGSPDITVLIATYNKSHVLKFAIQSVLRQTYQDFELWVIGDGCTDDTEQVVNAFQDPRIHWTNLPENSGYQSRPHNEGFRRARGRYIAYLNHDDMWLPNHLEILHREIVQSGADFVFSVLEVITTWSDPYPRIPDYPDAPRPPEASALLHKADVIRELGDWKDPDETHFTPRAEFLRRAQFSGKTFQLVPALTVLKFGYPQGSYLENADALQEKYANLIHQDPEFVHAQLAAMLIRANRELERLVTPRRFLFQVGETLRRLLVRQGIEPASLRFWKKRGKYVKDWQKKQGIRN